MRVEPLDGGRVLVAEGIGPGKRVVTQGAELLEPLDEQIRRFHPHTPPGITVPHAGPFHVFLSHNWANQDGVHTIKRQLQLMVPDAKIFLDGALEPRVLKSPMC